MPKLIQYRNHCIGCGICYELQPEIWRMSKKDGKATLVKGIPKKNVFILPISEEVAYESMATLEACPAKVIKLG
ncbi:MAG: ferredoxin [Bacteroidetes bacterium]|nr:ferredoxin [Bacteroidota bacterium]